ncbi:hypothetical protein [Mesorhizobium sp. M0088]|uniref:hypothetical protein n=1 Tax=Mesorhizobium sp. M0088 TaxID=2956873 RepID=UPI003334D0D6
MAVSHVAVGENRALAAIGDSGTIGELVILEQKAGNNSTACTYQSWQMSHLCLAKERLLTEFIAVYTRIKGFNDVSQF